jgi:hypothetical protein
MAKENMLCPFSGKLCQECPLYRGRHYYLCFNQHYRGHLSDTDKAPPGKPGAAESNAEPTWKPGKMPSAIDPSQQPMPDIWD